MGRFYLVSLDEHKMFYKEMLLRKKNAFSHLHYLGPCQAIASQLLSSVKAFQNSILHSVSQDLTSQPSFLAKYVIFFEVYQCHSYPGQRGHGRVTRGNLLLHCHSNGF